MVRPLTKTDLKGDLYTRPSAINAQIDETIHLSLSELKNRLLLTERNDPAYLRSECLVHLVRDGRRTDNQQLMTAVLSVLLGRCEAILLVKVPDGGIPDAAMIRQEILENLIDLFLTDGTGDIPNELDFYECKFNRAFMTLRIDAVRRKKRQREQSIPLVDLPSSGASNEPDTSEDAIARVSEAFRVLPTQEWDVFRESFVNAIEALPPDERDAVILVHHLGYKVESEDPGEETAATRCKCTGRTIHNRLSRAAAKLSRFKEDL